MSIIVVDTLVLGVADVVAVIVGVMLGVGAMWYVVVVVTGAGRRCRCHWGHLLIVVIVIIIVDDGGGDWHVDAGGGVVVAILGGGGDVVVVVVMVLWWW